MSYLPIKEMYLLLNNDQVYNATRETHKQMINSIIIKIGDLQMKMFEKKYVLMLSISVIFLRTVVDLLNKKKQQLNAQTKNSCSQNTGLISDNIDKFQFYHNFIDFSDKQKDLEIAFSLINLVLLDN